MKTLIAIAAALLGGWQEAAADLIYAPPQAATHFGDSSLGPLSPSTRTQQVYGQGTFPTLGSDSAFLIRMILFRADENAPAFGSANFSSLEVHLSTTSRNPDGLSTLFSENIGADDTIVFGRAPISLNWSSGGFQTAISFDRPFLYNPAAGNLLLDILNYSVGNSFPALDAFAVAGDPFSIMGGRVNDASGATITRGLATLFTADIVPIPEPSTISLLLLGALVLGWKLRRSFKSSSTQD